MQWLTRTEDLQALFHAQRIPSDWVQMELTGPFQPARFRLISGERVRCWVPARLGRSSCTLVWTSAQEVAKAQQILAQQRTSVAVIEVVCEPLTTVLGRHGAGTRRVGWVVNVRPVPAEADATAGAAPAARARPRPRRKP